MKNKLVNHTYAYKYIYMEYLYTYTYTYAVQRKREIQHKISKKIREHKAQTRFKMQHENKH